MRARLVVFPIKGRNWCFSRSAESSIHQSDHPKPSLKLKDLWNKIRSDGKPITENAETVVDFIAKKMNRAWTGLEIAPEGTFKNKLYGLGLRLLASVNPSEIFLKSISKDITEVEVTYPASLNPRYVRRRLRHMAMRGTIVHRRYLYGSVSLLPFTAAFAVLPLPNIPFFWFLFRTYSHWRALKGSERLLVLVSNCSRKWHSTSTTSEGDIKRISYEDLELELLHSTSCHWVLQPSEELQKLLGAADDEHGLGKCTISKICRIYQLDDKEVMKYRSL
ncbi:hypothetical protein Scep_007257 [Stephania cephalantha]|uniref:Uncharacterized protein n=1 Tax=Stephania cephalantha TaxID=152367 RepID=A0AAP0KC78_9MAGN